MNRRVFVGAAAAVGIDAAAQPFAWAQAVDAPALMPEEKLAADPQRPQFHLLPARNWMNDPNAPVYFQEQDHMFFQYNPHGPTWGDMSWNHAVSDDMLHWSHRPLALTPTPGTADAYGCFSGSALVVGSRVYAVYTGTVKSSPALATIKQDGVKESQCLAWSDDPQLATWTKEPDPILALPPLGLAVTGFRDPSAWKQGDWYYMTVGSGLSGVGGCVLLYRSRDVKTWEYMHALTAGRSTGVPAANPCDNGEMWECPEFFALDGQHVLIYSTTGKVFWQSGVLDEATMQFTARKTGLLDLDAFYAPKTQLDAKGRRILWGWIQERRGEAAMRQAGWSGMMSLPRVMTLDAEGMLRMTILPETRILRAGAIQPVQTVAEIKLSLPRATGEMRCEGKRGESLQLSMRVGEAQMLDASYDGREHAFTVAGHRIVLEAEDRPVIHGFVDGSVLELMIAERIGYTMRFYPDSHAASDVEVSASGRDVRLEAWRMEAISPNRLTTPAGSLPNHRA